MTVAIGEVERAILGQCQVLIVKQFCLVGGTFVATGVSCGVITRQAVSSNCGDNAVGSNFAHSIRAGIGNINAAIGAHGDADGTSQESLSRKSAISACLRIVYTRSAVSARDRIDDSIRVYASHHPVACVGGIDTSVGPDRHS